MILNHCEQGRNWPYDLNVPGDTQELCGLLKCIKSGVWIESWIFFFLEIQARLYWDPLLQQGEARTNNRFSCLLTPQGVRWAVSLNRVRVGVCPGLRLEGCLGVLPTPVAVLCERSMFSTLLLLLTLFLLQALQKWLLGFLDSWYLLFLIFPNCMCTQLFLVPHSFFVFCC